MTPKTHILFQMDPEEIEQLCASIINRIVNDIPMHFDAEENNADSVQLAAPNKQANQLQELLHVSAKCYRFCNVVFFLRLLMIIGLLPISIFKGK